MKATAHVPLTITSHCVHYGEPGKQRTYWEAAVYLGTTMIAEAGVNGFGMYLTKECAERAALQKARGQYNITVHRG